MKADILAEIRATGSLAAIPGLPDELKAVFVTSHEIPPDAHVRMQAAFQQHTDNAVSKTVNLPETAQSADIERVIWLAYQLQCKGVTVFRSGCKGGQVLSRGVRTVPAMVATGDGVQAGLEFTGECRNCTV